MGRRIPDPLQLSERGEEASLIWHLPGNDELSKLSTLIHVPTVVIVHGGAVPTKQSSFVDVVCDAVTQRGWAAVELAIQGVIPSQNTAR